MPCAAPCDHVPCSLRCEKMLSCGHQCPSVCGEACPLEKFCQTCGSEDIKDTQVDFIVGETYKEVDLDSNPCVFPQCGHFLTIENMDAQMDLKKHYVVDEMEKPILISSSSEPFSIEDIKVCAICRGSLRNISRYGRLVRRALIDQATKKFILYVNQKYVPMAQDLSTYESELQDSRALAQTKNLAVRIFQQHVQIFVKGRLSDQVQIMARHLGQANSSRWKSLLALRARLSEYQKRVEMEEQPFNQVRRMVQGACQRKQIAGQFVFDETVLQTKGYILASALLLRLDLVLLVDFLSLRKLVGTHQNKAKLELDLKENKIFSKSLISNAMASHRVFERAEGNIFLAQLCALERETATDPAEGESLRQQGEMAIEEAELICDLHPGQTRGLAEELEGIKSMLSGSTFYAPVTSEERMAVVNAMSQELRGTGHWYNCENGHPFTIGECGMAMEVSRCPECGSPVGGRNHTTIGGVTHARDLEEGLQEMQI